MIGWEAAGEADEGGAQAHFRLGGACACELEPVGEPRAPEPAL